MIYTSDHGQALFEGGYDIQQCSNSAEQSKGEVMVPIFVWAGSGAFAQRLREHARLGFNQATHFEVFPTLLSAMGFPQSWVRREYGPSLLDFPLSREPRLLVGGIFDVGAYWIKLDRTGASSPTTTLVTKPMVTPPKRSSRGSWRASKKPRRRCLERIWHAAVARHTPSPYPDPAPCAARLVARARPQPEIVSRFHRPVGALDAWIQAAGRQPNSLWLVWGCSCTATPSRKCRREHSRSRKRRA